MEDALLVNVRHAFQQLAEQTPAFLGIALEGTFVDQITQRLVRTILTREKRKEHTKKLR
jgi:hypothetical protein